MASKLGAYQGIAKGQEEDHRHEFSSFNRSGATAQDKEVWAEFLSGTEPRHVSPNLPNTRENLSRSKSPTSSLEQRPLRVPLNQRLALEQRPLRVPLNQ